MGVRHLSGHKIHVKVHEESSGFQYMQITDIKCVRLCVSSRMWEGSPKCFTDLDSLLPCSHHIWIGAGGAQVPTSA